MSKVAPKRLAPSRSGTLHERTLASSAVQDSASIGYQTPASLAIYNAFVPAPREFHEKGRSGPPLELAALHELCLCTSPSVSQSGPHAAE